MLDKLLFLFDKRSKVIILLLLIMTLVGTLLEMVGIGLVIPVITLFSIPEPLANNPILEQIYNWVHPESKTQFMVWILSGVILLYLVKNIYLFILNYLQTRFVYRKQYQIGCRLFRAYLHSPYTFHLKHNSSELLRNIKLVTTVVNSVLVPLMVCVTELLVAMAMTIFLVWVDSTSAIAITVSLGVFLSIYLRIFKKKLARIGESNNYHEKKIYQHISESLGSIKEIKVSGQEGFFNRIFSSDMWGYADTYRMTTTISQSGRFIVETMTLSIVIGVMILLLNSGKNANDVLVSLSLYAVAAVRLIPTANRLSWAITQIKFGAPSLNKVFTHLKDCENLIEGITNEKTAGEIIFNQQIEFHDVTHKYESSKKYSLDSASLVIPKNNTVALVGSSGAGKTTAIGLILGLLKPTSGRVLVDGKEIHQSLRSWQKQIGYVPQFIYIADDTIKNNVAFGIEEKFIDQEKVWNALRLAQLDLFVAELPEKLDALVGENGTSFSGGQKQRLGIARALYHEPQVLIMDEATTALDNQTERAFINSIENISEERTIILITHRITTVQNCDIIFFLNHGKLISSGTYDYLFSENAEFRQMSRA
jgi:ATP-binding cassette, subfamily B, bacterial PglK